MNPTKYDWNELDTLQVDEEVTLPIEQRPNAARAILRRRSSKVFTTRKINAREFVIRRVR